MTKFFRSFKFENFYKEKEKGRRKAFLFLSVRWYSGIVWEQKGLKFNSIVNMILSFVKSEWLWAIFSRNENPSENKRLFLKILFEFWETFHLNFKIHLIASTRLFILIFFFYFEDVVETMSMKSHKYSCLLRESYWRLDERFFMNFICNFWIKLETIRKLFISFNSSFQ
jgi:hypothetical protein